MVIRQLWKMKNRKLEREETRRRYHPTKAEREEDKKLEERKRYKILSSVRGPIYETDYKLKQLEDSVLTMMEKGWQPIGGVAVSILSDDEWTNEITFYQAMIKIDN